MRRDSDDAAADRADQMVGAKDVHFDANDAFDERAEPMGQLFAVPAVVAGQHAQILVRARRLATQFESALTDRAVIDQAIGSLLGRGGVSAQEAAERLRVLSEREQTTVAVVSDRVVREAVRRARAKWTDET